MDLREGFWGDAFGDEGIVFVRRAVESFSGYSVAWCHLEGYQQILGGLYGPSPELASM